MKLTNDKKDGAVKAGMEFEILQYCGCVQSKNFSNKYGDDCCIEVFSDDLDKVRVTTENREGSVSFEFSLQKLLVAIETFRGIVPDKGETRK